MSISVEVAIVGAGPYGLSIAAHLKASQVSFRIFGPPMETWREHMPAGMLLKSDGFASCLSDPGSTFTLQEFCKANSIPYDHTRVPVALKTFVDYGMAFQRRWLPELDTRMVDAVERDAGGFSLQLEDGSLVKAKKVVLAVGITHFAYVPPEFGGLPAALVSHSSEQKSPSALAGKTVAVIGAGASAVDLAALLHEAGADVSLIARRKAITFHNPPPEGGRSLLQRMRHPSSGLGPGWRSRLCTDVPGLFRYLSQDLRLKIVQRHLGPAPGWPMKARIVGKVPMHLGVSDLKAEAVGQKAQLTFTNADGAPTQLTFDHIVTATGYRVDLSRLKLLSAGLRDRIKAVQNTPVLSSKFQSSVTGLYFVGIAAANTFGPLMRFAFGADYTAHKLARHLAKSSRRLPSPAMETTRTTHVPAE